MALIPTFWGRADMAAVGVQIENIMYGGRKVKVNT
jgi:hypothetical protein